MIETKKPFQSSAKHTPGPWHITTNPAQDLVCAGDEVIADCTNVDLPYVTQANQRLIAAAPELLSVLHDVSALLPVASRMHPKDIYDLQSRVIAAIAKAEGR